MAPWALLLALPWDVEWDAPHGCPSEAAFSQMVEAEVEVQASADAPPILAAAVKIERLAEQWRLELQLRRGDVVDSRSFEAESCDAVVQAAALVVSMRLVEWMPQPPDEPASEPVPEPPPALPLTSGPLEDEPPPTEIPMSSDPPESAQHRPVFELGGWLGMHGGLAFGVAPGVGGAASLEGGLKGRSWRAGVAMQAMPRRSQSHPNRADIIGRFDLVQAELLGCGVPAAGPVEFPVCGRVAGGGLRAAGEGAVTRSEPAWGAWWGLGASAAVAWHVTDRLAPAFTLEALAPLRDWSFSVGSVPGDLYVTGPVALRAWLGLEIHL